MDFKDTLLMEQQNLISTIRKCGMMLQHLPKGRLSVQTGNDKLYYRLARDGSVTNIKDTDRQIELLQSRRLAEQVQKNAAFDLNKLNKFIRDYKQYDPNELISELSLAYQSVPQKAIEDMGFVYTKGFDQYEHDDDFHPEHLTHTDPEGNKKRSKSELAIDGVYRQLSMKPIYEFLLKLPDGTVIHPDFAVWSPLRKIYKFHDHIGDPTDPKAVRRATWKFKKFLEFGIYPFDQFIFTFESPTEGLNLEYIKILISTFMR